MALANDRFQAKVAVGLPDECWEWQGSRNGDGYGQLTMDGKTLKASRVVLAWKLGRPIAPRKCACHSCDNPPCCNPGHLWEGTHRENMMDGHAKDRVGTVIQTPETLAKMKANTPRGDRHWTKDRERVLKLSGEANGNSLITREIARDIRVRRAAGQMLKEIALVYGISLVNVSMICRNQTWVEPGQERQAKRKGKPGPEAKPAPVFTCQRPECGRTFTRRQRSDRETKYCSCKCAATANYGNLGDYAQGIASANIPS